MKNRGRGVQLLLTRFPIRKSVLPAPALPGRSIATIEDSVFAGKDLSSRTLFLFLISLHRYLVTSFPAQPLTLYMVMPLMSLGKKSVDFCGITSPDVAIFIT